jgi:hypothetical protein
VPADHEYNDAISDRLCRQPNSPESALDQVELLLEVEAFGLRVLR